jgi:hypothetical protein
MASRHRRQASIILTGDKECDAMLKAVGTKVGNRVARSVLSKAVRLAAKKIKAHTPIKSVKKAIGGSVKKQRGGAAKGLVTAKAGAAVGIKKAKAAPKGGTHSGVGIAAANVHWYILGTAERRVKTTGQMVGQMPPHDIVKQANVGGPVRSLIKKEFPATFERECEKESRRLLKRRR